MHGARQTALEAPGRMARTALSRRTAVGLAGWAFGSATAAGLGACTTAQGARGVPGERTNQGEVAPAAQLRRGATIAWAVDDGPTRTPLRQDQVRLFKEVFPDINVELISGATGAEKLQALFAAGTPPDLFRQETPGMAFFASRGQLTALDPYMKRDKYDLSDFFPAAWEIWRWKGRYYGAPFIGVRVLFYNRSLSQQAGARTPPASWRDASWTWPSFLEVCQKIAVRSGGNGARWAADLGNGRRDWQPWVWSNGGEVFNPSGTKVLLAEPPAVEALQFLADLVHRHRVAPKADELQAQGGRRGLFQGGHLLLYHNPTADVAANRRGAEFDWGLTSLPRGRAKAAAASGGGVGWFLAGTSRAKDETWELMKVLASKESVRLEAGRGEAPPSRRSVASEPGFINPPEPPGTDMKVVAEALEAIHVETPLIEGVEIDRVLDEELGPLWRGDMTARQAAAQAASRMTPLLNPPDS